MKRILLLLFVFCSLASVAQVSKVSLQASGLTCSMCSNSIYKSLKTVSFIDKIEPNIKTSTFNITFKAGSDVDFDKMKTKVEDAGYSVSKFVATINFKNAVVKTGEPVKVGNIKLQFVNVKETALNGEKQIRILSKGFVPTKEYKKNALPNAAASNVYLAAI